MGGDGSDKSRTISSFVMINNERICLQIRGEKNFLSNDYFLCDVVGEFL